MTTQQKLSGRIDELIDLANRTIATQTRSSSGMSSNVNKELFFELKTSSLSFIKNLYTEEHPYYRNFNERVTSSNPYDTEEGRGILKSIKTEIDKGWLISLRGLVTAEIFSDFLELSEHLLDEKYKDAAAVMIGSLLEEHLRQLCNIKGIAISVSDSKTGKLVPKKADLLNAELCKAAAYNALDQKAVTAWLDLRNKAAHGKYGEYTIQQVELMYQGVTDFMVRNNI